MPTLSPEPWSSARVPAAASPAPPRTAPCPRATGRPGRRWRTGIAFPEARLFHDPGTLSAALAERCGPYVLKASWLEHKTEAGGVRIGLADADAVTTAFIAMHRRLGEGEYTVEEQEVRPYVVELILGGLTHAGLGPVVTVGRRRHRVRTPPRHRHRMRARLTRQARAMIRRLRCAPLLTGWRGAPPAYLRSLVRAVVTVSQLIAGCQDGPAELEINPLRVGPQGALAVDALLLSPPARSGHREQEAP
ncbi:acetate--CoA ligase family protein [Streptomyces microflavus]|uniref:acetate--CoA ligase family protein n=1 Tax=Streptomyces microflavus TaxID=1919 RepID=UPI0038031999